MSMRGRPAVTRARVLGYIADYGPCSIRYLCRMTGADRRHVQRIIRAEEKMHGPIFAAVPNVI